MGLNSKVLTFHGWNHDEADKYFIQVQLRKRKMNSVLAGFVCINKWLRLLCVKMHLLSIRYMHTLLQYNIVTASISKAYYAS